MDKFYTAGSNAGKACAFLDSDLFKKTSLETAEDRVIASLAQTAAVACELLGFVGDIYQDERLDNFRKGYAEGYEAGIKLFAEENNDDGLQ